MRRKYFCLVIIFSAALFSLKTAANPFFSIPTFKQLNLVSSFEISNFYENEIVEFYFANGNWELEFDLRKKTFKPILDKIILSTNIPISDINHINYQMKVINNTSQCSTTTGGIGSRSFSTVWIDDYKVSSDGTVTISGEENLSFNEGDRVGLLSEHVIKVTFSKLNLGIDDKCRGSVILAAELEL